MKFLTKFFASLFLFLILASRFQIPVIAQNEFAVDATVTYKVQDSGKTVVTHDITLENLFSTLYATTYTLSLENIDAQNISAIDEKGKAIQIDIQKNSSKTDIKLTFSNAVVGSGAKRNFFISYENPSFAIRTGEVWEVSIPRLGDSNSFRNYKVILDIPSSFGLEAYVSPKPQTSESSDRGHVYIFNKDDIIQTGITAGFGQFQVFSFNLSYHLENPLASSTQTQVAIPPDTAFQKVYIQKVDPKPDKITIDGDGNWLAIYKLTPRQRIDVAVMGAVQIFASYRPFPKPINQVLSDNLKPTQYWQTTDPKIIALAQQLKTPSAIYNYVSTTLKYGFGRVQPNVQRMGALDALQNPTQAICMEFTDLFIALARAAGIPAREINGYAYTENHDLQPLSLVADVLHSWPEYYDKDKGAWIPVDPTWGATTGGIDFFSKLDLRHFAFVIHGKDSIMPYPPGSYKLGPNPQKDVFVSFGKLPSERNSMPSLNATIIRAIPFFDNIYSVKIYNPGPVALYSVYPTIYFDGNFRNRDFVAVLPPFSSYEMKVNVPFSILGKDTPNIVKIMVDGVALNISTNKTQVIINSLLVLCAVFLGILLGILIKLGKIRIDVKKFFAKTP